MLVGEVPAAESGFDGELGDVEPAGGSQGLPSRRRSMAARIFLRIGSVSGAAVGFIDDSPGSC